MSNASERLEYLRGELRAERISYGELHELQGLAEHIDPGDVELLDAAGVPEHSVTPPHDEMEEFTAEAYFRIDAPDAATAKRALAAAQDLVDEALRKVGTSDDFPFGTNVELGLENEHGDVEAA